MTLILYFCYSLLKNHDFLFCIIIVTALCCVHSALRFKGRCRSCLTHSSNVFLLLAPPLFFDPASSTLLQANSQSLVLLWLSCRIENRDFLQKSNRIEIPISPPPISILHHSFTSMYSSSVRPKQAINRQVSEAWCRHRWRMCSVMILNLTPCSLHNYFITILIYYIKAASKSCFLVYISITN